MGHVVPEIATYAALLPRGMTAAITTTALTHGFRAVTRADMPTQQDWHNLQTGTHYIGQVGKGQKVVFCLSNTGRRWVVAMETTPEPTDEDAIVADLRAAFGDAPHDFDPVPNREKLTFPGFLGSFNLLTRWQHGELFQ